MGNSSRLIALTLLVVIVSFSVYFFVPSGEIEYIEVYVADESIPEGEQFSEDFVKKIKIVEKQSWMITDITQLNDLFATRTISKGRFIENKDFIKEQTVIYQKNEGEYTIKAKSEYMNGGKIEVGDRVNVLFVNRKVVSEDNTNETKTIQNAENVVDDVMVISIRNQQGKDILEAENDKKINDAPHAITLKVEDEMAEKLAWAQENGTLSLYVHRKSVEE